MTQPSSRPRRPRDSAATRQAILKAAHEHFLRASYDQVGLRDIAETAQVNVALINRYFGSKAELFTQAVMSGASLDGVLQKDLDLPTVVARYYLELKRAEGRFDQVLAMLRSFHQEQVAEMFRKDLQESFVEPLAQRLDGEGAELRGGMAIALLLGLAVMRDVLSTEPLASASEADILDAMVPMLRACLGNRSDS